MQTILASRAHIIVNHFAVNSYVVSYFHYSICVYMLKLDEDVFISLLLLNRITREMRSFRLLFLLSSFNRRLAMWYVIGVVSICSKPCSKWCSLRALDRTICEVAWNVPHEWDCCKKVFWFSAFPSNKQTNIEQELDVTEHGNDFPNASFFSWNQLQFPSWVALFASFQRLI